MLSPLLFIIVMEAVTHSVREGLPWETLYADDLVLVGRCEEELKEKLRKWNECFKDKGLKINEEKSFICRRCKGELCETRQANSQVNSQVNGLYIDGHEYEIVDRFCYLGDMLSQEGGCEHAILKRIQTGWLKFRELSGLLIGKGTSLRAKGIIYTTCIRPAMLYGSETWPTKIEDIRKIQRSEMRMLRWMTGVSLGVRKSNECVRSMLAIDDITEVMRRNRLRWFGHVERRDELFWIKRIETLAGRW